MPNLVRADSPLKADQVPGRYGFESQLSEEISAKTHLQNKFSINKKETDSYANLPAGKQDANSATSLDFATKRLSNGAIQDQRNWADSLEDVDPEIEDGFTDVQGKKRRRGSAESPTTAAHSNSAIVTHRQRSSTGWVPRVQEVKTTRTHIVEARAREASSTEVQCIYVEHCPEFQPYHYLKAIDKVVGGARSIIQLTRMNGHVLVEGVHYKTFPFRKRSVKITKGNLPLFVGDAAVIDAQSPYGRVTSIAPKQLRAGEYGYTDGRRETYILFHDGMTIERLPTRLDLRIKGETWPSFLTFVIRCSRCHNQAPELPRRSSAAPPAPAPPDPAMEVSSTLPAARAAPHRPTVPQPSPPAPPSSSMEVPTPTPASPAPSLEMPSDGPTAHTAPQPAEPAPPTPHKEESTPAIVTSTSPLPAPMTQEDQETEREDRPYDKLDVAQVFIAKIARNRCLDHLIMVALLFFKKCSSQEASLNIILVSQVLHIHDKLLSTLTTMIVMVKSILQNINQKCHFDVETPVRKSMFSCQIEVLLGSTTTALHFLSRFPNPEKGEKEEDMGEILLIENSILGYVLVSDKTQEYPTLRKLYKLVKYDKYDVDSDVDIKPYIRIKNEITIVRNFLFFGNRMIIPDSLREYVLNIIHENHIGINKMKTLARFWKRIHLDYFYFAGKPFLILVDAHSNWIECQMVPNTSAGFCIDFLGECLARYGIPEVAVMDNGPPFRSYEMKTFFERNAIHAMFSPAYHPESNGQAEVSVREIKKAMRRIISEERELPLEFSLIKALYAYRLSPLTRTEKSPAGIFLNCEIRSKISMLSKKSEFGANPIFSTIREVNPQSCEQLVNSQLNPIVSTPFSLDRLPFSIQTLCPRYFPLWIPYHFSQRLRPPQFNQSTINSASLKSSACGTDAAHAPTTDRKTNGVAADTWPSDLTRHPKDTSPTMQDPYTSIQKKQSRWTVPSQQARHSNARAVQIARNLHTSARAVQTAPTQQHARRPTPPPHARDVQATQAFRPPAERDNSHTKHIGDHTPSHNYHMTNPYNELDTHPNTQQNPLPHAYYNTTSNTRYTPQFTTLLQKYTHIFTQNKFNVPCLRIPPVKIPTNSEKIITIRPYRVPICDQQEIRNQVQQMLENGIIEQSFSPFSSPVTLVTKRDKTKRFCIDYRKVNELISSDVHPLPRIEDILDRLAQAKYFSTADISSAYWQVPIHPDSRPLLAFATLEGLYQPTRLPFGLKTSPQIYERTISQVLQRHGLDCVAHYFDDFIIYSNTLEEHQNHLRQFFAFCEAEKLQLNFVKCEFFKQSIDFLGYTITAGTITPLTRNTDIIHAIKQPLNRKTLQSFLGAVNVYNKFIPEYARLRAPLNNLLKKDVVWNWNEACQKAFIDLKGNLTQHPILHLYKEGLPCQVYCDASTLGIAGILKQVQPDGNVYPVQYFSRTLRPHEKNYSISELECLAIVESVEKFRIYLMGRKFTIFSDHHALQWLKTIKNPSGKLFRWSLRLSSYEYEVRYIKGKLQYEADLLSRNPFCGFLDATLIKTHQPPPSKEFSLTIDRNGLHTVSRKGVTKIIIPKLLIQQLLQTVHTQYNHPGISQMSRLISTQYYWRGMSKDIKQKVKTCPTCQLTKRPLGPTYGELSQPPEAKEPFDLLSLDTIAGFAKYGNTKIYLHVVVDHFSRYAWTFPSKSTSSTTYQQVLKRVLQDGSPKRLLTDRAPAFTSPKFRNFLLNRNIHPLLTTSNNPQANGLCERLNATLTGKLRLLHLENPKIAWTKLVKRITIIYNKTPHSTTGFPPIYLMFGILPPEISNHSTPYPDIDKARKIAHTRTQNKHLQDKNIYDQRHKQPHFEVGDLVLVKLYHHPNTGKLAPYFTGPHTVLEIISPNVVRIDRPNQPLQRDNDTIHVNKLKLYTETVRYISPPAVSICHIKHKPDYTFPFKHLTPELFPAEPLRFKPTNSEPFRHLDPAIFATRRFAPFFPDIKNCEPDNQFNHITPLPQDIKQCEIERPTMNKVRTNISESPFTTIWKNMYRYPIFHLIFILGLLVLPYK
ncbi:hypothetical protein LAZ67_13000295 [Cordylochernes scorpioides]|uniref:RNA-directed DNA polymerase n=1 Tax=Cordylochernes scorpioides TaxID=51811 RepID=A0ABY6L3K5_9ARAC|nr:hypothetical protein LAZ67_13000295 [Cordylochernes scorpioides]